MHFIKKFFELSTLNLHLTFFYVVKHLLPRETVAELDRHIIGQNDAKRAVAVALSTLSLSPSFHSSPLPPHLLLHLFCPHLLSPLPYLPHHSSDLVVG